MVRAPPLPLVRLLAEYWTSGRPRPAAKARAGQHPQHKLLRLCTDFKVGTTRALLCVRMCVWQCYTVGRIPGRWGVVHDRREAHWRPPGPLARVDHPTAREHGAAPGLHTRELLLSQAHGGPEAT